MLPVRRLGRTGRAVPALGFGVSGPLALPILDDRTVTGLVKDALAGGVRLFDTAPFYGGGRGELRLAEALSGRDDAVILTKVGTRRPRPGRMRKDFSPDGVRAQVAESRARLGRIDGLFLHGPEPKHLTEALAERLAPFKAHGGISFVGVCGRGPELDAAISWGVADVLMAPTPPGLGAPARAVLERARAAGLGVIGIEAMGPAVRGWRRPRSLADLWYLARRARHGAAAGPVHAPEEALAEALSEGPADAVIVTTTRPAHLAANIAVAQRFEAQRIDAARAGA